MKKLRFILLTALVMLCAAGTAYADAVVGPVEAIMGYLPAVFVIALAVIIIVIIIKEIKKRKR